ncbi:unnamed protein product [Phytophthora lilii]|uniref:Unnamed protein product n=1 Tax=Phytophthora lilii TaxID=2077276 RepID=A0A9W7CM61_9STRA|nr:unnamed protein product [Phytophthora lilii]
MFLQQEQRTWWQYQGAATINHVGYDDARGNFEVYSKKQSSLNLASTRCKKHGRGAPTSRARGNQKRKKQCCNAESSEPKDQRARPDVATRIQHNKKVAFVTRKLTLQGCCTPVALLLDWEDVVLAMNRYVPKDGFSLTILSSSKLSMAENSQRLSKRSSVAASLPYQMNPGLEKQLQIVTRKQ